MPVPLIRIETEVISDKLNPSVADVPLTVAPIPAKAELVLFPRKRIVFIFSSSSSAEISELPVDISFFDTHSLFMYPIFVESLVRYQKTPEDTALSGLFAKPPLKSSKRRRFSLIGLIVESPDILILADGSIESEILIYGEYRSVGIPAIINESLFISALYGVPAKRFFLLLQNL